MDRLLSSSTCRKLYGSATIRFHSAELHLSPSLPPSRLSISCNCSNNQNPFPLSLSLSSSNTSSASTPLFASPSPNHLPSLPPSSYASHSLNHNHVQKVPLTQGQAITARTIGILCTLAVILIQPAIAPSASASAATAVGGKLKLVRTEVLSSAWTGFFAGCLHTLSGPDHLAALAPLSIGRTRRESAAVGALWGCGHDAGQLIFGLTFLLFKDRLHIEFLRTWCTRVVGLTLLLIGAIGIKEAASESEVSSAPCVALQNGECDSDIDAYESLHNPTPTVVGKKKKKKKIGFATFATGIVHGLQPDALMMVLPALALPSRLAGAAFLIMFLFGTVLAMGSYTAFIGSCSQALKDKIPSLTQKLTWASSFVAIALGFAIIVTPFLGFSLY